MGLRNGAGQWQCDGSTIPIESTSEYRLATEGDWRPRRRISVFGRRISDFGFMHNITDLLALSFGAHSNSPASAFTAFDSKFNWDTGLSGGTVAHRAYENSAVTSSRFPSCPDLVLSQDSIAISVSISISRPHREVHIPPWRPQRRSGKPGVLWPPFGHRLMGNDSWHLLVSAGICLRQKWTLASAGIAHLLPFSDPDPDGPPVEWVTAVQVGRAGTHKIARTRFRQVEMGMRFIRQPTTSYLANLWPTI